MHIALKDKTNQKNKEMRKASNETEKESVLSYIKKVENNTKDFNLKYDLTKCIEILEGKENQEFADMREALEEVLLEKEQLFKEKCELAVELDYIKSKEKKHKKKS
jgi:uncharacterized protein YqgV (UPF0045/DUF77 family)